MTKLRPTRYSEQNAINRFDKPPLTNALTIPRKLPTMTATLKRRALKKKQGQPEKKAGTVAAAPAI